jgi:hypothetical protein
MIPRRPPCASIFSGRAMNCSRPKLRIREALAPLGATGVAPTLLVAATLSCLAAGLLPTAATAELGRVPAPGESAQKASGSDGEKNSAEQLSADELAAHIDALLAASWKSQGIEPAAKTTDAEFVRRAYLDLIGRIPSVAETLAFLDDTQPNKRKALVEELLSRGAWAAHFANTWRDLLLAGASAEARTQSPALEAWLRLRFVVNMPYDQMIRELLTAPIRTTATSAAEPSPAAFYQAAEYKPEHLAANTSRVLLGIQLQCAECHNHPFSDWKQEQFWQYAAFFKGVAGEANSAAMTTPTGDADSIQIPDTKTAVTAKFLDGTTPERKANESLRVTLARWTTKPENELFAPAAVNRLWNHFFGRGLVSPVDNLDKTNPPSHPEVFAELTHQFVLHGYDMKYVVRAITATEAYQCASRQQSVNAATATDAQKAIAAQQARNFARMPLRRMTSDQLFASFIQSTGFQPAVSTPTQAQNNARSDFETRFGDNSVPSTETPTTILQALALMNGKYVSEAVDLKQSKTLAAISEAPYLETEGRIETLFIAALSRRPTNAEREQSLAFVKDGGSSNEKAALADIFWSLLNSAEFVLNH